MRQILCLIVVFFLVVGAKAKTTDSKSVKPIVAAAGSAATAWATDSKTAAPSTGLPATMPDPNMMAALTDPKTMPSKEALDVLSNPNALPDPATLDAVTTLSGNMPDKAMLDVLSQPNAIPDKATLDLISNPAFRSLFSGTPEEVKARLDALANVATVAPAAQAMAAMAPPPAPAKDER